jgi:hypothetical protein
MMKANPRRQITEGQRIRTHRWITSIDKLTLSTIKVVAIQAGLSLACDFKIAQVRRDSPS